MCFPKYSLCETYRQGSSEISFIHLNIDNSFYACYSSVKVLLSINTLLEPRRSNYSLKKNLFSDLSGVKTGRSGDLLGPKDLSSLVNDPSGKSASKIRHDQPDLEISDNKFFSRNDSMIRQRQKCVDAQGSTFTDE